VMANPPRGDTFNKEQCEEAVRRFLLESDKHTYTAYEVWARGIDGIPSGPTVRAKCGSWKKAVEA
jgi:hypothetical protein